MSGTQDPLFLNVGGAAAPRAEMGKAERDRAIEALALSELKYRNLFTHMPMALWQIDVRGMVPILRDLRAQGVRDLQAHLEADPGLFAHILQVMRVEMVNDRTVQLFGGTSAEDFIGPIARFWQDSAGTMLRSLAARYDGADAWQEETRVRTIDGRTVEVFYTAAFPPALVDLGISIVGAVDIGARLRAERALQRVNADFAHAARLTTLGELTASIAHEVNQPLAAITTNAEASMRWLARPEPDLEELRALAQRMTIDARRAAEIISRIRAMAARRAFETQPIEVNMLVAEGLKLLDHEMLGKGVSLDLDLASDLPKAMGDMTQLQQVFVNLAMNAVQAMDAAGSPEPQLIVRTRDIDRHMIAIDVEDRGPGIPRDVAAQLFDSFFTTKKDGLGIGLSICRSIIDAHGGTIGVENLPVGARFTFTLPVQA